MIYKIIKSRDLRAKRQKEFLALYKKPLISVTVNIPGIQKLSDDALYIFKVMIDRLENCFKNRLNKLICIKEDTGIEAIYCVDMNAQKIKTLTIELENSEILGRFIDFDVLDINGQILSRKDLNYGPRKCFLCSNRAVVCAKGRIHEEEELLNYIKFCVKLYKKMLTFSYLASKSLYLEVDLTPKPGLVDRHDSGSHKDMDRFTFYKSIQAIEKYFLTFLSAGFLHENSTFRRLREIGKECEKSMYKATLGINTHKGIIFSFAIILGAIGVLLRKNYPLCEDTLKHNIKQICKNLVKNDLSNKNSYKSAGERYFSKTKNGGIRQEAQNGYCTIFDISLPFYRKKRVNFSEDTALKMTLLKLISEIEDTTLYNRGGLNGLKFAKYHAKLNICKFSNTKLLKLNQLFIKENLSPGGSADMLALTWFLDKILVKG